MTRIPARGGPAALVLALLAGLSGCNRADHPTIGAGGGGATTPAFVDVLLGATPDDELFLLRTLVESLVLERADGTLTGELTVAPVQVELQGLLGRQAWLTGAPVPAASYAALVLRLRPSALEARLLDGTALAVDSTADMVRLPLAAALDLAAGDYTRLVVVFDADASVVIGGGRLTFTPIASAAPAGPLDVLELEQLDGFVGVRDVGTLALAIDGFSGPEGSAALGSIDVAVAPGALLLDELSRAIAQPASYFTLLSPRVTVLDVTGALDADGTVRAGRLEIDSQSGIPGSRYRVRLDGTVVGFPTQRSFLLRIRQVDRGRALADPVLAALGNPAEIEIAFDERTVFVDGPDEVDPSIGLVSGRLVRVKFGDFAGEPLPALRVDLEGFDPRF